METSSSEVSEDVIEFVRSADRAVGRSVAYNYEVLNNEADGRLRNDPEDLLARIVDEVGFIGQQGGFDTIVIDYGNWVGNYTRETTLPINIINF